MSEAMDDAIASNDSLALVEDNPGVSGNEIFSDMLRHMMAPLLIGMLFWEHLATYCYAEN